MHTSRLNLRFGIWTASACILLGLAYMASLAAIGLSGSGYPPVEPYDVVASIVMLISASAILVLFSVIHAVTDEDRKLFSLTALVFCILFAGMTSINRFTHLAIVRPSLSQGITAGLEWFTPYGAHSIMTGLEVLGWGFFLGLAFMFLAAVFQHGRLERGLSALLVLEAVFCLAAAISPVVAVPWLIYVGAAAWGPGFIIVCVLLIFWFRKNL